MGRWLKYILLFIVLVGLQILVFSHIQLRGVANAFPYVFFIIALPFGTSGRTVLILGALLGFSVDLFSGTLGVHMAATVCASYMRMILLPALSPQGDYEIGATPSVLSNGWGWFLRFSTFTVLVHHIILFFVESFSFLDLGVTLLNVLASSVLSLVVICLFQTAISKDFT